MNENGLLSKSIDRSIINSLIGY